MIPAFVVSYAVLAGAKDLFLIRSPWRRYKQYRNLRGMAFLPDVIDWLGGYPFEVASPSAIIDFFGKLKFQLMALKTVGKKAGNNEYVFRLCAD